MRQVTTHAGILQLHVGALRSLKAIDSHLTRSALPKGKHRGGVNIKIGREVLDGGLEILKHRISYSPLQQQVGSINGR